MRYFIMKISKKIQLQQIASNQSSDIDFKEFVKLYKGHTRKQYSFLVNDGTFPSDNSLQFRRKVL